MILTVKPGSELRLADLSCLDGLLPLFRAYQEHYRALTDASEEQTREFLAQLLVRAENGFVVIAEIDGAIVGFATGFLTVSGVMAERMVHLGDLYVVPAHRHNGIATSLINEVSAQARLRGIKIVRWLSMAANGELNAWYEALGAKSADFKLFLRPTDTDTTNAP